MPAAPTLTKKPVNLSLSEDLVKESRLYCGNLSAKVEDLLQAYVVSEREHRGQHQQAALQAVTAWNTLHDEAGSYADEHSTL